MNYPVWQLDFFGGGLPIALIAVFHVFISQFAIGGGLFLVLTEMKGYRQGSQAILDYVKRHTRFFLLVSMVLGGMTGVGIWFTIALISPAATSVLIHNFVFAWAIEWVFFVGEIVSLLIYYQTFGRMARRDHLTLGWLYFVFAWLSLFVINGILCFMLTPGEWLVSGNFWDGFFNPTFWPSLLFRTFLCLLLAGLYGFLTATTIKDEETRLSMVRYCATWLLAPFLLLLASAWWYVQGLPPEPKRWITTMSAELSPYVATFLALSPVLFLGGLLMAIRLPAASKRGLAVALMLVGITWMGSFEYIREGSRRPWLISGHIYSNSVFAKEVAATQASGVLAKAKWTEKSITPQNRLAVGRQLFNVLCSSCHSVDGPMRDIKKLTAKYLTVSAMAAEISGHGTMIRTMPEFPGNNAERHALAAFLIEGLHGRTTPEPDLPLTAVPKAPPLPFDPEKSEYVLLAWNSMGMHCLTDDDAIFSLLPPANDLAAQLIKRGPTPEVVTSGVVLSYEVEDGFGEPSKQVDFWKHQNALFGTNQPVDVGLAGQGMRGEMRPAPDGKSFAADKVPVVPYPARGGFQPYPLFTLEARDSATKTVLATTRVVAPVSSEMGCRNCHGGGWRVAGVAGFARKTSEDILAAHDRLNGTSLAKQAKAGRPVLCQSCHADPALNAGGDPKRLNLSAAMHGWHANFLKGQGAEACSLCHPGASGGASRCLRGIHAKVGLNCTNCHGSIEDHALSLLKAEQNSGKAGAERLMRHLSPRMVKTVAEINPRTPWLNQPDCLSCHVGFAPPETDNAFNQWTTGGDALYRNRSDESGSLRCAACHGAPHAEYPATNPYGPERDNQQPLQYQGNHAPIGANRNCQVCHTMEMDTELHHPNSLATMRNQ
ncbi:MAG: cytochrome ubiquinol oxidase subunit I [Thermodesulfobacteriota bacterium]